VPWTSGTDVVGASAWSIGVDVHCGVPGAVEVEPHGVDVVGLDGDGPVPDESDSEVADAEANPVAFIGAACPLWGDCVMRGPLEIAQRSLWSDFLGCSCHS
jgi:hypothetical protein